MLRLHKVAVVIKPDVCGYTLCAILYKLTSVLGKGCLHTAIRSMILSFPSLIMLLLKSIEKDTMSYCYYTEVGYYLAKITVHLCK